MWKPSDEHGLPAAERDRLFGIPFLNIRGVSARMSMLVYLRHPEAVKALLLVRITGGDFAAGRLPEMYYGQFIRAAEQGGMAVRAGVKLSQYLYRADLPVSQTNRRRDGVTGDWLTEVSAGWLKPGSAPTFPIR